MKSARFAGSPLLCGVKEARMSSKLYRVLATLVVMVLFLPATNMYAQHPNTTTFESPAFKNQDFLLPLSQELPMGGSVRLIVELEDPPLATYRGDIEGLALASRSLDGHLEVQSVEAQRYLAHLERTQLTFRQNLARALPQAQVSRYLDAQGGEQELSYSMDFHGMTLSLPSLDRETLLRLAELPGAKAISPVRGDLLAL